MKKNPELANPRKRVKQSYAWSARVPIFARDRRAPVGARSCDSLFIFQYNIKKSRTCEGLSPKQSRDRSAQVPIFARDHHVAPLLVISLIY